MDRNDENVEILTIVTELLLMPLLLLLHENENAGTNNGKPQKQNNTGYMVERSKVAAAFEAQQQC